MFRIFGIFLYVLLWCIASNQQLLANYVNNSKENNDIIENTKNIKCRSFDQFHRSYLKERESYRGLYVMMMPNVYIADFSIKSLSLPSFSADQSIESLAASQKMNDHSLYTTSKVHQIRQSFGISPPTNEEGVGADYTQKKKRLESEDIALNESLYSEPYSANISKDTSVNDDLTISAQVAMEELYAIKRDDSLSESIVAPDSSNFEKPQKIQNIQTVPRYGSMRMPRVSSNLIANIGYTGSCFGLEFSCFMLSWRDIQESIGTENGVIDSIRALFISNGRMKQESKFLSYPLFSLSIASVFFRQKVAMMNFYTLLALPNFKNIFFYFGGGGNIANTKLVYHRVFDLISRTKGEFAASSNTDCGWNVIAGLRFFISKKVFGDIRYSYSFLGELPTSNQIKIRDSEVVRLRFTNIPKTGVYVSMLGLSIGIRF